MDNEKVIKGLYDIGDFVAERIGIERARDFIRTIDDAIAMLKEQESKDRMFHALEEDWKLLKELLKEQEARMQCIKGKCRICPHCDNCDVDENGLLKEQEAVEPTLIREGRNKYYNDYVCPRCDNGVVYEQNYCSECGIPFMWEGR